MMMRPTGTIMAPPMPCRKRAATKVNSVLDKAHRMEPAMKVIIAERKIVRAPTLSAIQPEIGMNTPRLTTYEVSASFKVIGSCPRSRASAGSEVAMTVTSMFSMNRAQPTMSGTMSEGDTMTQNDVNEGQGCFGEIDASAAF